MRQFFLSILFYLCINTLQAQTWAWSKAWGNGRADKATTIKYHNDGTLYVTGYFSLTGLDLGNGVIQNLIYSTGTQSKEIYVAKFDTLGNCLWSNGAGGTFDDRIMGMGLDSFGNCYVTGTFYSSIKVNGVVISPTSGCCDQCLIGKLDKNGQWIWATWVGSNGADDQGLDIATDKLGNSYIVGFMSGLNLFKGGESGPVLTVPNGPQNTYDYWLMKIDSSGKHQWTRSFGNLPFDPSVGKYVERDIALCIDDSNGVYVTGGFDGSRKFGDSTFTSIGGSDVFVIKYDTAGSFKWAKQVGSNDDDWSNGITYDHKGNIYVTGEHRDSLFVDTVIVKNYDGRDVFILKMDANAGSALWGKRAGTNYGGERGNDVFADSNCHIYVTGDIHGGAKFGSIDIPPNDSIQTFVARINEDGEWLWVTTGGGPDEDRGNSITKGANNDIYYCGFFKPSGQFGPNNFTCLNGKTDAFMGKIRDNMYDITCTIITPNDGDTVSGGPIGGGSLGSIDNPNDTAYVPPPDNVSLSMPNVFSPNGDGLNDVFHPLFLNAKAKDILGFEVKIYSRFGNMVYFSNDPTKGWDGTLNGEKASPDNYFFTLKYTTPMGRTNIEKGSVLLIW
jgi:gliding motility-associated-like protein